MREGHDASQHGVAPNLGVAASRFASSRPAQLIEGRPKRLIPADTAFGVQYGQHD